MFHLSQVFWLTVLLANNFNQLVVGRFIAGLSGGLFVCVPLFVTEIANKEFVNVFILKSLN